MYVCICIILTFYTHTCARMRHNLPLQCTNTQTIHLNKSIYLLKLYTVKVHFERRPLNGTVHVRILFRVSIPVLVLRIQVHVLQIQVRVQRNLVRVQRNLVRLRFRVRFRVQRNLVQLRFRLRDHVRVRVQRNLLRLRFRLRDHVLVRV